MSSLNWGYERQDLGPNEWSKYYQTGELQSPINIVVGNCEHLLNSTCCNRRPICKSSNSPKQVSAITDRLRNNLSIDETSHQKNKLNRRSHLDSIGEDLRDYSRNSSTSPSHSDLSSGSSSSSSPVQLSDRLSCSDEDDDLNRITPSNRLSKVRCLARQQQDRQNTRFCSTNKKIFLGYPRYMSSMQLCNTGHSWQINLPIELANHTLLSGPPLGDREYRLAQVHCHWGENCNQGSEHQLNGKSFAAEIHFVHWNCSQFQTVEEASRYKHGLAVLGVFVQALEGEQHSNKHLDKIITGLKRIQKAGASAKVDASLDLKKLFPVNRWNYASYEGSLTTPPLSEVVDWIVFLSPIQCSESQIESFRQIRAETSGSLRKNCRPIQPTNNRLVSIWTHH